ncbi:MAG: DUF4368 domain-containing protein [Oscillospiraceae bacterium]|nr:DUF4368 domain-containing protein [Oscillospiraceae bacterium]
MYNMLNNRTYLGHCVNGKRTVLSFKNKRVVRKAEDEWIVVENVFPPLVTEQLWNDAHERLKTRKHESTTGFVNLFAGLLKCDHCGKGLGLSNTKDHSNYYVCNTYKKKGPTKCTSHYLPYDDLYGLVLTEVQRALVAVKANREAFIQSVQAKLNAGDESRRKALEMERDELAARVADLSKKYRQLYDDRYKGILSDRMFMELFAECESERISAEERLEAVQQTLTEQEETREGVELFADIAEQYDDITELDREILNRLIAKIVVGDRIRENGRSTQKVTVYYNFIGNL